MTLLRGKKSTILGQCEVKMSVNPLKRTKKESKVLSPPSESTSTSESEKEIILQETRSSLKSKDIIIKHPRSWHYFSI